MLTVAELWVDGVAAGMLFAASPFAIPGLGDGDGAADADGPAGATAMGTGSTAGLESFCSDAGAMGEVVEACDACVGDSESEDGKLDGKESTSPPLFAEADGV